MSRVSSQRSRPALAARALVALRVLLAGLIARELGRGTVAQLRAASAVVASPRFLRTGDLFQPVVFDQLWWTLALYALVKLGTSAPSDDALSTAPRGWIVLGRACGLGLLTKFSLLFFGAALVAAILISPQRRVILTPWPWLAAVIAFVIGSPSIVGQVVLGYPVVAQMKTLQHSQLEHVSAWSFVAGQFYLGAAALLALGGALYLVLAERMRPFRAVGWTCIFAFLLLLVLHGKSYYIGPIYPSLFAAGAVAFERWTDRGSYRAMSLVRALAVVVLVSYDALAGALERPS